jgi:hypothetical protein
MSDRTDEIRERVTEASPEPWEVIRGKEADDYGVTEKGVAGCTIAQMLCDEDAEFIAHARTDIPYLLAEVSSLESQLAEKDRWAGEQIQRAAEQIQKSAEEIRALEVRLQAVTEALMKVRTWIESDPCDVREPLEWIDEALTEPTERKP